MAFTITTDKDAPTLRNPKRTDVGAFDVTVVPKEHVVSGSEQSTSTEDDAVFDNLTAATVDNAPFVRAENINLEDDILFTSTDESVATVDGEGQTARVADGSVGILIKVGQVTRRADITVSRQGGQTTTQFKEWAEGSLGKHIANAVDSRIEGTDPEVAKSIWTTRNHSSSTYVRNTSCWAYDLASKLAAVSTWNSFSGSTRMVTALTPRHCVGVPHSNYIPPAGSVIRFVTADNQVVERTVVRRVYPDDYSQPVDFPDLGICLLNADLPESIGFTQVLPSGWNDHLVQFANGRPPTLSLDNPDNALVKEVANLNNSASVVSATSSRPLRQSYNRGLIAGDSGNPSFFIVNGELVLVTCWTTSAGGTHIANQISMLNGLISAADTDAGINTGYTITEADFSSFTDFSES